MSVVQIKKGDIARIWWNTNAADGSSVNPTVNGTIRGYEDASATPITAGITATYAVGSVGRHRADIDTSNAAYSIGSFYGFTDEGMTIDGQPVNAGLPDTIEIFAQDIDSVYGNGLIRGEWRWDTAVTATDPGAGNVKANNATYASVTEVYINAASDKGFNATAIIKNMKAGDLLVIADESNTGEFFDGTVSGTPVDNTGWFTIPITIASTGDVIGNNQLVDVGFLRLINSVDVTAWQGLDLDGANMIEDDAGDKRWTTQALEQARGTNLAALASNTALEATSQSILARTDVATSSVAALPPTNTALNNVGMLMVLSSDHATPATGLTPTLTRSIDGGAFAAKDAGTTVAEVGFGIYQIDLAAADTNGTIITYRLDAATADDANMTIRFG